MQRKEDYLLNPVYQRVSLVWANSYSLWRTTYSKINSLRKLKGRHMPMSINTYTVITKLCTLYIMNPYSILIVLNHINFSSLVQQFDEELNKPFCLENNKLINSRTMTINTATFPIAASIHPLQELSENYKHDLSCF